MREYLKPYKTETQCYTILIKDEKFLIHGHPDYPFSSRTLAFSGDDIIYFRNEADMIAFDNRDIPLSHSNILERGRQIYDKITKDVVNV